MKKLPLSDKKLYILLHILAWAFLFILPYYLVNFNSESSMSFLKGVFIRTLVYVFLFYLNFLWLIPKLLFNKKAKAYFLALGIVITLMYFVVDNGQKHFFRQAQRDEEMRQPQSINRSPDDNKIYRRPPMQLHLYDHLLISLLVTGFSIGLKVSGKLIETEKERKELEKEKLNSELAFLKNQVSPHFFFNTLNNIYTLIQINADDAQRSVLQLSKLMRYLLYESEQGDAKLSREIDFMNNYIDLMKLRLTSKVDLKISFPTEYKDFSLPPLLFIPFIENAFKHGVSYRERSFIDISLTVLDNELQFKSTNSIGSVNKGPGTDSGIGLENVQKRLSLLFPGKHDLKIQQTELLFIVLLKIDISNLYNKI
jgi:two-component system, LytTR family, sensor kinase